MGENTPSDRKCHAECGHLCVYTMGAVLFGGETINEEQTKTNVRPQEC